MTDDRGKQVEEAGPSIPVEILGLPDVPESGDIFYAVKDDKVARSLAGATNSPGAIVIETSRSAVTPFSNRLVRDSVLIPAVIGHLLRPGLPESRW